LTLASQGGIPVVVSMGDLAASGGYYISCLADSVFAEPNTLTGSIGVFSIVPNFGPMLKNKLGITFDGVKTANYADALTVTRALTDQEKRIMQRDVDRIYGDFKARAVAIKEERSDLVKHHLWVLWTDYFKAPHFEKYPQLNGLFNEATKLAGAGGTKGSLDVAVADNLIAKIDEIAEIFWETKEA